MVTRGGMKAGLRAARKVTGRLLLVLVVLILLVLASFLLATTRQAWLGLGLDVALRSLPGDVSGSWYWPKLNRLEVRDLIWTAPHIEDAAVDTLAVVETLVVQFDWQALRAHDLLVDELTARASLIDVPRIMATLQREPTTPATPTAPDSLDTGGMIPFLREGGLAGIPSAGITRVELGLGRLVLGNGMEADQIHLSGSASVLAGDTPHLVLRGLSGQASSVGDPRWRVDLASLQGTARYDQATRVVSIDSLGATIPTVSFAADTLQFEAGPLALSAKGIWGPEGWDLKSDLRLRLAVPEPLQNPIAGITLREFTGKLGLASHGTVSEAWLEVALNLDPSADLKVGTLHGSVQGSLKPEPAVVEARLDDLRLQWRGTNLEGHGRWDGNTIEGRILADLADLELPKLVVPQLLPGVEGRVRVEGSVSGQAKDPHLKGKVSAAGDVASVWALPGVTEASAALPAGFPRDDFRKVALDLEAGFEGSLSELTVDARADLSRTPWLERGLLQGRALVARRPEAPGKLALGHVGLDSLVVALRGGEVLVSGTLDTLQADLKSTVSMTGTDLLELVAPGAWIGSTIDLKGSLQVAGPWHDLHGEVAMGGQAATSDFDIPVFEAAVTGSARDIMAEARARGGVRFGTVLLDSLAVTWAGHPDSSGGLPVGDFSLQGWAPEMSGWLRGSAAGDSVRTAVIDTLVFTAAGQVVHSAGPATLQQGPRPRDLMVSGLRLRGDLGRVDVEGRFAAEGLTMAASTDLLLTKEWLETLFPSPFWSAGGGVDLTAKGDVALSTIGDSGGEEPIMRGHTGLALVPRNEEPPARLDLDFHLAQGDSAGLLAELVFGVGETSLVKGSLLWPGKIDPVGGRWVPAQGTEGGINIPEQELPLAFFNRFLPPEVSLEGSLTVGAGLAMARGDSVAPLVTDSAVTGLAHTKGLKLNLPNRSWVNLEAEVGLEGRLIDPRLAGEITVSSGLYRLPEIQRSLHPVNGNSVLWSAAREAMVDSSLHEEISQWAGDLLEEDSAAPYFPDLDLQVNIPGQLNVVGYGLEAEMAGSFKVSRGLDKKGRPAPVMRGHLQVVEGTLNALNRVFDVERGDFTLEGRIPVDPSLNLSLMTDIDGTIIRIKVMGTALQPKITLESDPEMIQADILAFLLFGQPVNNLDTDQGGSMSEQQSASQQLRQNIQGLALAFGASSLQNQVSGKIGVDQVQIGSDSAGGSTLVLGKYINPRLLLKYNQSLEMSGTYFMTMEYTLSRVFKLISTYGQGEESSGLELRWQRRY